MKMRMYANLGDSSLVVFEKALIDPEIIWKEKGREFILHGEMYDIIKITKNAGKTYFHCINDRLEKKLLNDFASKIGHQASGNDKEKKSAHHLKFKLQDVISIDLQEDPVIFTQLFDHYYMDDEALITSNKKVIVPPPRC